MLVPPISGPGSGAYVFIESGTYTANIKLGLYKYTPVKLIGVSLEVKIVDLNISESINI